MCLFFRFYFYICETISIKTIERKKIEIKKKIMKHLETMVIRLVLTFGLICVSEGILFGRLFRDSKKTVSSPDQIAREVQEIRAKYAELGK